MSTSHVISEAFTISCGNDLFIRGNVHTISDGNIKPVILLCHGFKGFKDWGFFPYAAEKMAEKGFHVIRFNFSCNGVGVTDFDELEKFAINTYSREQEDLDILLDYIQNNHLPFSNQFDLNRITLVGHSRGGGTSLLFAAEHLEIKAVVTWNGIADVDLFDEQLKDEIRKNGIAFISNARTKQQMPIRSIVLEDMEKYKERYHILSKIKELQIPFLAIQGKEDMKRLVEGAQLMKKAAPHQSFIDIPEANHTFGAVHPFQGTTPQLENTLLETISFLQSALN